MKGGNQPQAADAGGMTQEANARSNVRDTLPVLSLPKDESGQREGRGNGRVQVL